ncbi:sugar phosphate isomerase/epimerase family protein [Paenibacillus chungangensis]|uniref:Sugar phosphate isomerase/epimerase family protein n=1 Tax=Paenibacillus chungangensis TaxID=696535 RepID=A0ABW3HKS0_9BACL
MMIPGMLSVTFRKLAPQEIVTLTKQAGLQAIAWGSDVHVPAGNLELAAEVGKLTTDAGLQVAAYASYYRLGSGEGEDFDQLAETAESLGTKVIRVWAGSCGSAEADETTWDRVSEDARRVAAIAASRSMTVTLEYHQNTLTDTLESTLKLLQLVPEPSFTCDWQRLHEGESELFRQEIEALRGRLFNLHVSYYQDRVQQPLAAGDQAWLSHFKQVNTFGGSRYALIEFVADGEPKQFLEDAATLLALIGEAEAVSARS